MQLTSVDPHGGSQLIRAGAATDERQAGVGSSSPLRDLVIGGERGKKGGTPWDSH
jgi:hypothetical protein